MDSYENHLPPHIARKGPGASHKAKIAKASKPTREELRAFLDETFAAVTANPRYRTPKILEGFAEEYAKLG